ncbi:hypothetical protein [Falsibacillus pallidus]|uniref:Uncharacterized protein n=1 Tax=Falsibacillus pallidus TaxID=493781 RepID=A0A370G5T8_9BACI|nr:hypothetical protein [Falsibacillus pallidus]RDI39177.1 hypothetical protein DFR59_11584 [Falsibacillus pallidus]
MKRWKMLITAALILGGWWMTPDKPASAACANGSYDLLDNDNNQLNSPDNSYSGNWVHASSSLSYRSEHRYLASSPSSGSSDYSWIFPSCSNLYGSLYVYIDNTKFTNANAVYRMYNNSSQVLSTSLNQRYAARGWNYAGKTPGAKTGKVVLSVPSGQLGGTGADAVKVLYSSN